MLGNLFANPKPVKKSGVKKIDRKVSKALKSSKGKCVSCKKNKRQGDSLFCRSCHRKGNY